MIADWIRLWDERIATWVEANAPRVKGGLPFIPGCEPIAQAYGLRGGDAFLDPDALPEPYVGNPASERLSALIISLNPAEALEGQKHPNGSLIRALRDTGKRYSELSANWEFLPETKIWWRRRARFAGLIVESELSWDDIVGIDLVPFHSKKFGGFRGSGAAPWLLENVFRPARTIAERTNLVRLMREVDSDALPVCLAIGQPVVSQLEKLGFEMKFTIGPNCGLEEWPKRNGADVDRRFTWMESEPFGLSVLQTSGSSMDPPASEFGGLLRTLIFQREFRRRLEAGCSHGARKAGSGATRAGSERRSTLGRNTVRTRRYVDERPYVVGRCRFGRSKSRAGWWELYRENEFLGFFENGRAARERAEELEPTGL